MKYTNKKNTNRNYTKWKILFFTLLLTVSLTGCENRKNPNDQSNQENPPPTQNQPSQQQDEPNPLLNQESQSPPSDSVIEPQDEQTPTQPMPDDSNSSEQGEKNSNNESSPDSSSSSSKQEKDSKSMAVSSVNYAQLTNLDATKKGWGPGGPVDENNRSQGAISYQQLYGKYNADFVGNLEQKIFLTFDEGYENGYTSLILDTLKEKNVSAVFFVTMPYVKENPDLIKRMIDEGHIVGNHSVNHPSFPDTPLSECEQEIMELHQYMQENFQYTMTLFRFPMGEFNEQNLKLVQDLGYHSVFWSFAYKDWLVDQQPDPTEAISTIIDKAHPGGIYLLHAVSKTNTEILGTVIDQLRDLGYEFSPYQSPTATATE